MLLFLPLSMSCGPGDAEVAAEACETQSAGWDGWGRGFFTKWCGACHSVSSATRKGPPLRHELGTTPSAVIGQALTSFW